MWGDEAAGGANESGSTEGDVHCARLAHSPQYARPHRRLPAAHSCTHLVRVTESAWQGNIPAFASGSATGTPVAASVQPPESSKPTPNAAALAALDAFVQEDDAGVTSPDLTTTGQSVTTTGQTEATKKLPSAPNGVEDDDDNDGKRPKGWTLPA